MKTESVDPDMLRYLTAGESHGPALTAMVEGFPSGIALETGLVDRGLERRQGGYGRGKRQSLETDRVIVDSGTYHGRTTGTPITLRLINKDAKLERLAEPAARAAATSTCPARSTTRPASARSSNAPAPARRRSGSPSAPWPGCSSASWGSPSSATSASWGDRRAAPLVRHVGARRQPRLHAQPRGRPGDRRRDRRRQGGRRHPGGDRRGDRHRLPDRPRSPPSGTASSTPGWPPRS